VKEEILEVRLCQDDDIPMTQIWDEKGTGVAPKRPDMLRFEIAS